MRYLTEKILGEYLNSLFPNNEFVHDKIVPNSGTRRRPDYRCDELMLIVEFDGYFHYTQAEKIFNESEKSKTYSDMGYKVVRIPYFVQMTKQIVGHYFGIEAEIEQEYNHGFIDKKCVLPCDFCELGITKFILDIELLPNNVKQDVVKSLEDKIKEKGSILKVIPSSISNLIDTKK